MQMRFQLKQKKVRRRIKFGFSKGVVNAHVFRYKNEVFFVRSGHAFATLLEK
jgi:hypothetical protein